MFGSDPFRGRRLFQADPFASGSTTGASDPFASGSGSLDPFSSGGGSVDPFATGTAADPFAGTGGDPFGDPFASSSAVDPLSAAAAAATDVPWDLGGGWFSGMGGGGVLCQGSPVCGSKAMAFKNSQLPLPYLPACPGS
jgi:hypothetical protein